LQLGGPTTEIIGSVGPKERQGQRGEAINWRFRDHNPTIRIFLRTRAFLSRHVMPDRRQPINEFIPLAEKSFLEKKPTFLGQGIIELFLDG